MSWKKISAKMRETGASIAKSRIANYLCAGLMSWKKAGAKMRDTGAASAKSLSAKYLRAGLVRWKKISAGTREVTCAWITKSRVGNYFFAGLDCRLSLVVVWIVSAGLAVNLAAALVDKIRGRIDECRIAQCQWDWVIIDLLVFAGLMLFALFLGARVYRGAVQHRLVAEGRRAPPVDVLILPVSKPKRNEQSHFDGNKLAKVVRLAEKNGGVIADAHKGDAALHGNADWLELFTCPQLRIGGNDRGDYFSAFSWATGFKTIDFFLKSSKTRLRAIHLVPSSETADDARDYYRAAIKALIGDRIAPRQIDCKINKENWVEAAVSAPTFHLIVHDRVKYDSFEAVQNKIRHIVDTETKRQGHAPCDIAIDVTGGGSAFSGAAAIESTSEHVIYSYVPPLEDETHAETLNDPLPYNVVATSVSAG